MLSRISWISSISLLLVWCRSYARSARSEYSFI